MPICLICVNSLLTESFTLVTALSIVIDFRWVLSEEERIMVPYMQVFHLVQCFLNQYLLLGLLQLFSHRFNFIFNEIACKLDFASGRLYVLLEHALSLSMVTGRDWRCVYAAYLLDWISDRSIAIANLWEEGSIPLGSNGRVAMDVEFAIQVANASTSVL